jgi:S-formylglutathione hydrolase FrmB
VPDVLALLPIGHLPIASWGLAGLLAGLASVAGVAGWRRRLLLLPASLLALVACATGLNAWFDAYPRLSSFSPTSGWAVVRAHHRLASDASTQGAIETLHLPGPRSGFGTHLGYAYLPPQYFTQPQRRFPVLLLLHGSPGRPADWLIGGRAAAAGRHSADLGEPIIIVMPTASRSWLDDSECVNGSSGRLETYLTQDVVQSVEHSLRTLDGRRHWGIGGMSAGGFCALNLGLRDRSTFSTVLDLSGLTEPTHTGGRAALFGRGPRGALAAASNDPSHYVAALPATPTTHVRFVAGTDDPGPRREILALAPRLAARGLDVSVDLRSGHHTYRVWAPALNAFLPGIARLLGSSSPSSTGVR